MRNTLMMSRNILLKLKCKSPVSNLNGFRSLSISSNVCEKHSCKFLVVGGGSAGCAMASKISMDYPKHETIVLEPNQHHYYQPLFTLVGGGLKKFKSSFKNTKDILPSKVKWLQDSVFSFNPAQNEVQTTNGNIINYDYMIVATGMQLNYNAVPGLEDALKNPSSGVCSIYSPKYVENTWLNIQAVTEGETLFTFPNTPVKCPGAPQKIMYLAEDYWRRKNRRDKINVTYNTSLPVIFGVKKYADSLWKVVKSRDINVNLRKNLIEVNPSLKQAVFQNLDEPNEKSVVNYQFLHVSPPMGPLPALMNAKELVNEAGFVTVDKFTMQHTNFKNIFALGDCANSPNSKTAAAVAAQSYVVQMNLRNLIDGKPFNNAYDGYASCPLVTSNNKCILAEFNYDLTPTETFPIDQGQELQSMFYMKKYVMPWLYWELMTRGLWNGPETFRKLMRPFKKL